MKILTERTFQTDTLHIMKIDDGNTLTAKNYKTEKLMTRIPKFYK